MKTLQQYIYKGIQTMLAILLFAGIARPAVAATDLDVTCDGSGTCTTSNALPLFPSSIVWYPGLTVTKVVRVINTSASVQDIGTIAQNTSASGGLDQVMSLSITRVSTAAVVWSGTLNDFYGAGQIQLASFGGGGTFDDFNFAIGMDQAAGNQYQGTQTAFDLVLGFIGTPVTPTPTPTTSSSSSSSNSSSSSTSSNTNSNGGGGSVSGASVSTPVPSGGITGGFDLGFTDQVLGAATESGELTATESAATPSSEGEVAGSETVASCNSCHSVPLLLVLAGVLLLYYFWMVGKYAVPKPMVVGIVIPVVTYLFFLVLNKDCVTNGIFIRSESFSCRFFWAFDAIIFALISLVRKLMKLPPKEQPPSVGV